MSEPARKKARADGSAVAERLRGLELDEERYVALMTNLIGEVEFLQNNPPKLVPKEDKACHHLMEALKPFTEAEGGPLRVEHIAYKPERGNLIIRYPCGKENAPVVGLVGSHLDVVPANPETWERNPFKLTREGDKLYGRGTTDCLGHVGMITELFMQLATAKPLLDVDVIAVFIASEENSSIPEVGVDMLLKDGKLEDLRRGPVFWVDSADSQPCIGTASAIQWHLHVTGKLFHSGLPHRGINPLEFGSEALRIIQDRFYKDFPPHEEEQRYNFQVPSTMKPTQWKVAEGSLNQIPPHATISGDVRLTPFYDDKKVIAALHRYVDEINADPTQVPTRGPASKYILPEEDLKATLKFDIPGDVFRGIACSLDTNGHRALLEATKEVLGEVKPYSISGSLPLVRDLQEAGYDVQISGYGKSSVYHGDNEYCNISDMKDALRILLRVVAILNEAKQA